MTFQIQLLLDIIRFNFLFRFGIDENHSTRNKYWKKLYSLSRNLLAKLKTGSDNYLYTTMIYFTSY